MPRPVTITYRVYFRLTPAGDGSALECAQLFADAAVNAAKARGIRRASRNLGRDDSEDDVCAPG